MTSQTRIAELQARIEAERIQADAMLSDNAAAIQRGEGAPWSYGLIVECSSEITRFADQLAAIMKGAEV